MFKPQCLPVLIGSLPVNDHNEAVELILKYSSEIPLWPQLPQNKGEGMVRQFMSGFPGLVDEGKKSFIDIEQEDFPHQMALFYEDYLQAETDESFLSTSRFSVSEDTAPGFKTFLDIINIKKPPYYSLKGQVTGPVTTGIGIKDNAGNSIIYDDNLRDMLVKHLAMKGYYQAVQLKKYTPNTHPLIFIDEPGMVSFGSTAFSGVTREMVTEAVNDVILAIKKGGALAGVHICANGDWGPALDSSADIISFDAYSYFDNFILFKDKLIDFLSRGGILAWGIIPTGDPEAVAKEDSISLFEKWQEQFSIITGFGFSTEKIINQTLIAPACGTGSLSLDLATKVLSMNKDISNKCREYYSDYIL